MPGNDDPTMMSDSSPNPDATLPTSEGADGPIKTQAFGDYQLLDEIARGGMGVVYRARQVSLNRTVALKMILSGQFASENDVRRFYQEAESAANLDHPGIVPIYEIGEHEGHHFFSMKLIEGGSLAELLPELRNDPRKLVRLIADVAHAVHHAHQRGILHRDLKPANILIDDGGNPLVSDLGLAKQIQSDSNITHTGAVVGTPAYMPPEQAAAEKEITTAADIYSIGAILYEALAGKPPHKGDTPMQTLLLVMESDVRSPRDLDSSVDRFLELICLKCLERDPERRYSSAAALAEDLENWLDGNPISLRPRSLASALGEAVRTNLRSALGAACVGVVAGLLVSFCSSRMMTMGEVVNNPPQTVYAAFDATPPVSRNLVFVNEVRMPENGQVIYLLGCLFVLYLVGMAVFALTRSRPGSASIALGTVAGLLMTVTYFSCQCGFVMVTHFSHGNALSDEVAALAKVAVGTEEQAIEARAELTQGFPELEKIDEEKRADLLARRLYYDAIYNVPVGILTGIAMSTLFCLPTTIVGTQFASKLYKDRGRWRSIILPFMELMPVVVWISGVICFQSMLSHIDGFTVGNAHIADRWGLQLLVIVVLVAHAVMVYRQSLAWGWRLALLIGLFVAYCAL